MSFVDGPGGGASDLTSTTLISSLVSDYANSGAVCHYIAGVYSIVRPVMRRSLASLYSSEARSTAISSVDARFGE